MNFIPPKNGWRTFVIVWATQSVSVFGSALTLFAVNIWLATVLYPRAEQRADLAFALSAYNIAFALPVVFGAPLAGAWADRHDRKRTMMVADLLNGIVSAALVGLMATGSLNLWMLLGFAVVGSVLGAFHGAAFDTSYAMLVPEHRLARANGMMQTIWSLSGILSPALAASLIALPALARQGVIPSIPGAWLASLSDGTPLAISIDAATFLLSALVLLFLVVPSPKRADMDAGQTKPSIWADVRAGALYIWQRRPLLWLLGTFTVANFALSPVLVLLPLLTKFNLGADWNANGFTFETALALLSSVTGIGGVVGGVLIIAWGGLRRKRVYGVVVPMLISGIAVTALGLSSLMAVSLAALFIDSAMGPILNAHSQTIWQMQTPRELQGRVFSVRRLIAQFSWPLSTAIAGLTAGLFDAGAVVTVCGALLTVFCIAQLFNPYLLRVEDKAWLDQMAAGKLKSEVEI